MSTSGGSYTTLLVAPLPHKRKTSNVVVIPAFRGHLVRQSIYGQGSTPGHASLTQKETMYRIILFMTLPQDTKTQYGQRR